VPANKEPGTYTAVLSLTIWFANTLQPCWTGGLVLCHPPNMYMCFTTVPSLHTQDGYCSLAVFDQGELGEPVPLEELPPQVGERGGCVREVCGGRVCTS
jgi:hypothetical protein